MSDDWPKFLEKEAIDPKYSLVVILAGILLFHGFLVWLLEFVLPMPEHWGIGIASVLTIGLALFVLGGLELNYWASRYWDKKNENAPQHQHQDWPQDPELEESD